MRIVGLQVGGHEAAALKWLEANRPDLFEKLEQERVKHGFEDWSEADGQGLIKKFMLDHGFVRMAGDRSEMFMEGKPNSTQLKLATDSAIMRGSQLTHDLGGRTRTLYMPGMEELEMMSARNKGWLAGDDHLASWFGDVIDSLMGAGVDVSVLEGLNRGGIWTKRMIRLVVGSVGAPSKDDLVLALHEAGHEVFDKLGLPPGVQDAFHEAIATLSKPEDFTPVIAKGMNEGKVLPQEVLVERTGRALVEQGFNPAEAKSIADRLVRYMKRAYYRASMAVQVGLLGQEHVNPELVEKYFQERVKAFLAGDSPMSFLSFLGGPKLTTAQLGDTFRPKGGSGALSGVFNYETGQMEYRERLPETMAAMRFNASQAAADYQRYQELTGSMRGKTLDQAMAAAKEIEAIKNRNDGMPPKPVEEEAKFSVRDNASPAFNTTSDPNIVSRDLNSPDKVKEDIAAFNALHDMHQTAFKAFEKSHPGKLTLDQFVKLFTNADGPALDKVNARNADLVANGFPPADTTPRPADLLSEASQMQSATKALEMGWSLREWWSQKAKQADFFLKTAEQKMTRINARLGDLVKRYTDMDLQFSNAKEELKDLHSDFGDDLKAVEGSARRAGVLAQVIAQLDQRLDNPLAAAKPYETTINRLYARLTGDRTGSFIDLLQKVSDLSIDWKTVKISEAADLISRMVAPGDPELKQLESRAMAAITVAFAKSNYHVMEFLKLSRDKAFTDRARLNEISRAALENADNAIPRARELARKLPRLAVSADRLLDKLEEVKAESHANLDATHRAKVFLDFHRDASPALNLQMVALEKMIGARLQSWEPTDRAEYYLASSPGATEDQVLANKRELRLNGIEGNEDVVKHIQQNNAWLNAVPADKRGAVWNTMKEMTTKLEQTAALAGHELNIKSSFINYALGSIVDKLESFGIGSGRSAAARVRRYSAERHAAASDADTKGGKWDAAEATEP